MQPLRCPLQDAVARPHRAVRAIQQLPPPLIEGDPQLGTRVLLSGPRNGRVRHPRSTPPGGCGTQHGPLKNTTQKKGILPKLKNTKKGGKKTHLCSRQKGLPTFILGHCQPTFFPTTVISCGAAPIFSFVQIDGSDVIFGLKHQRSKLH